MRKLALVLFSSFGMVGCEEAPLPTPEGAFFLHLEDSGATCNLATHEQEMGTIRKEGTLVTIADGSDGVSVACSVVAAAGGFDISAELDADANLSISVKGISSANDSEENAKEGSVGYVATETGGDVYSSSACKFWVEPNDSQKVAGGEAWLSFTCDTVTSEGNECRIGPSFVALTGCDGTVAEE